MMGLLMTQGLIKNQILRWFKFVDSWKRAAASGDTMVFGDTNIDYCRWASLDPKHSRMVEKMKEEIKTIGFHQMVTEVTRSWSGQPDSLIDQCWVNAPQRIIVVKNLVRSFSDHNLVLVSFRTKNKIENKHKFHRRERRNFDGDQYRRDIGNIDWKPFFDSEDLDFLITIL